MFHGCSSSFGSAQSYTFPLFGISNVHLKLSGGVDGVEGNSGEMDETGEQKDLSPAVVTMESEPFRDKGTCQSGQGTDSVRKAH